MTLLDAAMGTALLDRGLAAGRLPETWLRERPGEIAAVHAGHVRAGATVVTTCTFNLARLDAADEPLDPFDLARRAVSLARAARPRQVAGGVGPAVASGSHEGAQGARESQERYERAFGALAAAGVDLLLAESQLRRTEALAALAAGRALGLPVHVTCWLRPGADGPLALDGTPGFELLAELASAGASAVGVNCVPADAELVRAVAELASRVSVPIVARPSAGLPGAIQEPDEFAGWLAKAARAGATLVGGCCGAGPAHLRAVAAALGLAPRDQARG